MAACYGQLQYSTMNEGRHNQWAGKQASDHCPITVLIASNNGCLHRKTSTGTALKMCSKIPPNLDPNDFGSQNGFGRIASGVTWLLLSTTVQRQLPHLRRH